MGCKKSIRYCTFMSRTPILAYCIVTTNKAYSYTFGCFKGRVTDLEVVSSLLRPIHRALPAIKEEWPI